MMMNQTSEQRRDKILFELRNNGKVYVVRLAELLEVTPETIRRDLSDMEKKQLLTRTHGGAVPFTGNLLEPIFDKKRRMEKKEKQKIGKKAAETIKKGDTIVIDTGTTTLELCAAIEGVANITILTNSLAGAALLTRRLEQKYFSGKIIVLGGVVNTAQHSIKGSLTAQMLAPFKVNKAYLSCGGISEQSVSDYDIEEINISKIMMSIADENFVLADHTKLDRQAFYTINKLDCFDNIICDAEPDGKWDKLCQQNQITWIKA